MAIGRAAVLAHIDSRNCNSQGKLVGQSTNPMDEIEKPAASCEASASVFGHLTSHRPSVPTELRHFSLPD